MCTNDENLSTTNITFFILLAVVVILLILILPIALVTITLLVHWKKREKHFEVQQDHEEHIYTPSPLDRSKSATKYDDEIPNVAYAASQELDLMM